MLNVVVLNGGRGAASLIPALLARPGLHVTSVVNAYDDGKSTGEIRRFFDMLGPSDIRKVQQLMLPDGDPLHAPSNALFDLRYDVGVSRDEVLGDMRRFAGGGDALAGIAVGGTRLAGPLRHFVREFIDGLEVIEPARSSLFSFDDCSLMNCLYAGAFLACGRDLELTTRTMERLFRLSGTVLPNSLENKWLAAVRENGEILYSESEIVELRSNVRVASIYLLDRGLDAERLSTLSLDQQRYYLAKHHAAPIGSPGVLLALEQADIIIYSAGTQHSSLYPTYLSRGIAETIATNRAALKIFVTNIGADYETPSYSASDYIRGAYRYLLLADGREQALSELFTAVLVNNGRRKADETYVEDDEAAFADIAARRIVGDFESEQSPGKHDGARLVAAILGLYDEMVGQS